MEEIKKPRPIHYPHYPRRPVKHDYDFYHLLKKLVGRHLWIKTRCCDVEGILKAVHHDYIAVKEHKHHRIAYIRIKTICSVTPKVDP